MSEEESWQALLGIDGGRDGREGSLSPVFVGNQWIVVQKPLVGSSGTGDQGSAQPPPDRKEILQASPTRVSRSKLKHNKSGLEVDDQPPIYFSPIKTRSALKRKSDLLINDLSILPVKPPKKRSKTKECIVLKEISGPNTLLKKNKILKNQECPSPSLNKRDTGNIVKRNILYSTNTKLEHQTSSKVNIDDFYKSVIMLEEADQMLPPPKSRLAPFPGDSQKFVPVSALSVPQENSQCTSRVSKTPISHHKYETHVDKLYNNPVLNDSLNDFQFTELEQGYNVSKSNEQACNQSVELDVFSKNIDLKPVKNSDQVKSSYQDHFGENIFPSALRNANRQSSHFFRTKHVTNMTEASPTNSLVGNADPPEYICAEKTGQSISQTSRGCSNHSPNTMDVVKIKQISDSRDNPMSTELSLSSMQSKFKQGVEDSVRFFDISTPPDFCTSREQKVVLSTDIRCPSQTKPETLKVSRIATVKTNEINHESLQGSNAVGDKNDLSQKNSSSASGRMCDDLNNEVPENKEIKVNSIGSSIEILENLTPLEFNLTAFEDEQRNEVAINSKGLLNTECSQEIDFSCLLTKEENLRGRCDLNRKDCADSSTSDSRSEGMIKNSEESRSPVEALLQSILDKPSDVPLQRFLSEDFIDLNSTVVQFSTAGGGVVKTSQESLNKAKELMKDVLAEDKNSEKPLTATVLPQGLPLSVSSETSSNMKVPKVAAGFQEDSENETYKSKSSDLSPRHFPEEAHSGFKKCTDDKGMHAKTNHNIIGLTLGNLIDVNVPKIFQNQENSQPQTFQVESKTMEVELNSKGLNENSNIDIDNSSKINCTPTTSTIPHSPNVKVLFKDVSDVNVGPSHTSGYMLKDKTCNFYSANGVKVDVSDESLSKSKSLFSDIMDQQPESDFTERSCENKSLLCRTSGKELSNLTEVESTEPSTTTIEANKLRVTDNSFKQTQQGRSTTSEEIPQETMKKNLQDCTFSTNSSASEKLSEESLSTSSQENVFLHNQSVFEDLDYSTEAFINKESKAFLIHTIVNKTPTLGTPLQNVKLSSNKKLLSLSSRAKRRGKSHLDNTTPKNVRDRKILGWKSNSELQEKLKCAGYEEAVDSIMKSPEYDLSKPVSKPPSPLAGDNSRACTGDLPVGGTLPLTENSTRGCSQASESPVIADCLFKTAQGKKVKITKESLRKVTSQFKNEFEPSIHKNEVECIVKSPEYDLKKNKPQMFVTAKGNSVEVSEKSLMNVKNLFKDEFDAASEQWKHCTQGLKDNDFSFTTAKGKCVNASQESLMKVKSQFKEDLEPIGVTEGSQAEHGEPLNANPPTKMNMFFTAAGRKVDISLESLEKAKNLFMGEFESIRNEGELPDNNRANAGEIVSNTKVNSDNIIPGVQNTVQSTASVHSRDEGNCTVRAEKDLGELGSRHSTVNKLSDETNCPNTPKIVDSMNLATSNDPKWTLKHDEDNALSIKICKSPKNNDYHCHGLHVNNNRCKTEIYPHSIKEIKLESGSQEKNISSVICFNNVQVNEAEIQSGNVQKSIVQTDVQQSVPQTDVKSSELVIKSEQMPACSTAEESSGINRSSEVLHAQLKTSVNINLVGNSEVPDSFTAKASPQVMDDLPVDKIKYQCNRLEPGILRENNQQMPMFFTAKGNGVAITEESLQKARHLFKDDVEDCLNSKYLIGPLDKDPGQMSRKVTVTKPAEKEVEDSLQTVENEVKRHIETSVSNPSQRSEEHVVSPGMRAKEINVNIENGSRKCKDELESQYMVKSFEFRNQQIPMFSTAKGDSVLVTKESLQKIKNLFGDDFILNPNPDEPLKTECTEIPMEITAKSEVSSLDRDLPEARNIHKITDRNITKSLIGAEKLPLLSTANKAFSSVIDTGTNTKQNEPECPVLLTEIKSELSLEKSESAAAFYFKTPQNQMLVTASGKTVNVSHESLQKVKNLFNDEFESNKKMGEKVDTPENDLLTKEGSNHDSTNDITNSHKAGNNFCEQRAVSNELPIFLTAKGTSVNISNEALQKVRNMFKDELKGDTDQLIENNSQFDGKTVDKGRNVNHSEATGVYKKDSLHSNIDKNSEISSPDNVSFVFSTAKGTSVNVSERSVQKARRLLQDKGNEATNQPESSYSGTDPKCVFSTVSRSGEHVSPESQTKFKNKLDITNSHKAGNNFCEQRAVSNELPIFLTAKGTSVNISNEALQKVRNMFKDELRDTDQLIENNSQFGDKSVDKEQNVNHSEATRVYKNDSLHSNIDKNSEISSPDNVQVFFSTAKGTSVNISNEALQNVRNMFKDELKGDSDQLIENNSQFGDKSVDKGRNLNYYEATGVYKKDSLHSNIDKNSEISRPDNVSFVFSTAKGTSVNVSERSVQKARRLLQDKGNEATNQPESSYAGTDPRCVFSTVTRSGEHFSPESQTKFKNKMDDDHHLPTIKKTPMDKQPTAKENKDFVSVEINKNNENVCKMKFDGICDSPITRHTQLMDQFHESGPSQSGNQIESCGTVQENSALRGVSIAAEKNVGASEIVHPHLTDLPNERSDHHSMGHSSAPCITPESNLQQKPNIDSSESTDCLAFTPTLSSQRFHDELNRIEKLAFTEVRSSCEDRNQIGNNLSSMTPDVYETPVMYKRHTKINSSNVNISQKRLLYTSPPLREKATTSDNPAGKPYVTSQSSVTDRSRLKPLISCDIEFDSDDDILAAAETPVKLEINDSNESHVFESSWGKSEKRELDVISFVEPDSKKIKLMDPSQNVDMCEIIISREVKREEQKQNIISKTQNPPSQSQGLYMSIRSKETLLTFMENSLSNPGSYSQETLLEMGLHADVVNVTSKNAMEFQFDGHYFFGNECFSTSGGINLGNDFMVILSNDNKVGLKEISASFLASSDVDPSLVPENWIRNHYRWIVWKLASLEKSFPQILSRRYLLPVNVLHQLKYRYDREIDLVQRPALRRIIECDSPASRRFIGCVADFRKMESDELDPTIELELTDGWYSVWATIDSAMVNLVKKGKVKVGTKLMIHGAELLNCGDGCDPLQLKESVRLKLSTNSVRRAKWYAKMGFTRHPGPFCISLNSILPDGGTVGATTAVISRVYPILYMSKDTNGKSVVRNAQAENVIASDFEKERTLKTEELYEKILTEVETKYKKGPSNRLDLRNIKKLMNPAELYRIVSQEPDIQVSLCSEQLDIVRKYHDEISVKIQEEVKSALQEKLKELLPLRKVTNLLKLRISDPVTEYSAMVTVWRPTDDLCRLLKENKSIHFHALTACGTRDKVLQLSNTKQTYYKEDQGFTGTDKFRRRLISVSELVSRTCFPAFGELDIAGVVISVKKPEKPWGVSNVYLSDLNNNFLMIAFWTSLKVFGCEELLKEGAIISALNLHWRQGSGSYVVPSTFANELTSFSSHPSQEHIAKEISNLKSYFTKEEEISEFVRKKKETLSSLLKERSCNQTPVRRGDSLGLSPHIAKRLEKLKGYGPAPPLPRIPLLSSPDVRKGFKSPKVNKGPATSML